MSQEIKDFVLAWNQAHPIDLWWRKKHNIPFMSKLHKSISFIDQVFEYYEDKFYNEAIEEEMKKSGLIQDDEKNIEEEMKDLEKEFEQFINENE